MNVRFAEPLRDKPLELVGKEIEIADKAMDRPLPHLCQADINIGVFFDGTNNNKFRDTPHYSHSNVARLYEAYIGTPAQQQPPVLQPAVKGARREQRAIFADEKFQPAGFDATEFARHRKIYVPEVGTPFPHVGDTGYGVNKPLGLAVARVA